MAGQKRNVRYALINGRIWRFKRDTWLRYIGKIAAGAETTPEIEGARYIVPLNRLILGGFPSAERALEQLRQEMTEYKENDRQHKALIARVIDWAEAEHARRDPQNDEGGCAKDMPVARQRVRFTHYNDEYDDQYNAEF